MILLILILAIIAFIYFNVIPKKGHRPLALISLALAFLGVVGIVAHDYGHFGMKVKTTTSRQELVSSVTPKLPVLLYQPLGNGQEKVYLYKTNNAAKKPTASKTDHTSTKLQTAKTASVTIKTERYVFDNQFNRFLFGWFGHDQELKHREYNFKLPKNWRVLSVKEAKALQQKLARQAAMMKQVPAKK